MTSFDLSIYQGSDYNINLNLINSSGYPINLSGYQISGFVKNHFSDTGIIINLNPQIINAVSGIINLSIPGNETAGLPINIAFYDISISNGFSSSLVLNGKTFIYPSISASSSTFANVIITGFTSGTSQINDFISNLTSGVNTQLINYPNILPLPPKAVNCFIENNVDNFNYLYNASNITTSGFQVNFSDYLQNTGYVLSVFLGF